MRIQVEHETCYDYDAPVRLGPHLVRLRPRLDGGSAEIDYSLEVEPLPTTRRECLDAAGNRVTRLWFGGEASRLRLAVTLDVETGDAEHYAARLEPDEARLPPAYAAADAALLAPYLGLCGADPSLSALVEELSTAADSDALSFLSLLNQRLHQQIEREIRPSGAAQTPAQTLARGRGACRDQAVLFIAVCRAVGLAARFVSGYQDRSAIEGEGRHLHAWPEVYLPNTGWLGFDPTRGIPVADGHIAVAAAANPSGALPVEGCYFGDAGSRLTFALRIQVI